MTPRPFDELASRLGLRKAPLVLERAVTHGSANQTGASLATNAKLAFLGDAVLELVIRERIWLNEADAKIGDLSLRADTVSRNAALAQLARAASLGDYLRLGPGAERERDHDSVLATALEAIIAAVYLDETHEEAARVASLLLDRAVPPLG